MNRTFSCSNVTFAACGALLGALTFISGTTAAQAQSYTAGGDARIFAMGGAGVALSQERGAGSRANPASLAFENNEVLPTFPSFGVRATGPADANAASTYLLGGMKANDAISIAAQYGSASSELGLSGFTSLRMGKFEVSAGAVGLTHLDPNAAFQNWVSTDPTKNPVNLAPGARADLWSAGYYTLPSVATGFTLPARESNPYRLALGIRMKQMVGIYSHRVVQQEVTGNIADVSADLAPEMDGKDKLTRNGFGADVGMLMRPSSGYGVSAALVVANAVKPSFVFPVKDDSGNTIGQFDILQTTVTAGLGYTTRHGLTLAADLVNIGGQTSSSPTLAGFSATGQEYRFGAEQRVLKSIALRGGYSNLAGATYGFGFFGMDVAFGKKVPLEVLRTVNF